MISVETGKDLGHAGKTCSSQGNNTHQNHLHEEFTDMYYRWLPESPRWLIIQGRYKEALTVLTHAAKMNAKTLPQDDYIICAMTNIGKQVCIYLVVLS